jgi:hypothetical protein
VRSCASSCVVLIARCFGARTALGLFMDKSDGICIVAEAVCADWSFSAGPRDTAARRWSAFKRTRCGRLCPAVDALAPVSLCKIALHCCGASVRASASRVTWRCASGRVWQGGGTGWANMHPCAAVAHRMDIVLCFTDGEVQRCPADTRDGYVPVVCDVGVRCCGLLARWHGPARRTSPAVVRPSCVLLKR